MIQPCVQTQNGFVWGPYPEEKKPTKQQTLLFPVFIRILSVWPVTLCKLHAVSCLAHCFWQHGDKNSFLNWDILDGALFLIFFEGYYQFWIKKKSYEKTLLLFHMMEMYLRKWSYDGLGWKGPQAGRLKTAKTQWSRTVSNMRIFNWIITCLSWFTRLVASFFFSE